MRAGEQLRCPSCGALTAVRRPDGAVEVRRRGRLVAQVARGSAFCRCGAAVAIGGRSAEVVFRALAAGEAETMIMEKVVGS